jgi:hypothetical protein
VQDRHYRLQEYSKTPIGLAMRTSVFKPLFPFVRGLSKRASWGKHDFYDLLKRWRARTFALRQAHYFRDDQQPLKEEQRYGTARNCYPSIAIVTPAGFRCDKMFCPFCHARRVKRVARSIVLLWRQHPDYRIRFFRYRIPISLEGTVEDVMPRKNVVEMCGVFVDEGCRELPGWLPGDTKLTFKSGSYPPARIFPAMASLGTCFRYPKEYLYGDAVDCACLFLAFAGERLWERYGQFRGIVIPEDKEQDLEELS